MSSTRTFTFTNSGPSDVMITGISITPSDAGFTLPEIEFPVLVASGATYEFGVTASSLVIEEASATLSLAHDATGTASPITAPLTANFISNAPDYGPGSMMKARSGGVWGRLNKIAAYTFTDFTHQYWAKLLSTPAPQQFGQYYGHTFAGNVNNYRLTNGTLVFSATGLGQTSNVGEDSVLDTWVHWTYRRSGDTFSILKNGVVVKTDLGVSETPFDFFASDHDLYFGQVTIPTTEPQLAFRMSDFRMWNIARSDAEILADYQERLVGDEAGLVCYYPMSETDSAFADRTALNANIFLKNLVGTGPSADIGWNADGPACFD